ncbi:MAG TPA: hypothetical protein VHX37_06990 [Acidobacteriaceae bacterium]|jgi:hypothetical protein|nr:hypothetical protein [Acidobacteriaceae bacterium]
MSNAKISAFLCAILFSAATLLAQSAPGPVPAAIASAKAIFISNGGGDAGLFPEPFSGDPSRGYNQLYDALKASGQYQLVSDPSEADLVLEIKLNAPYGSLRDNKVAGNADPRPMFTLTVYDRKTHYALWTLTRTIEYAYLQKTHDHNFDTAIAAIASQFEALSGEPATATP